jgi:glucose 1-dehydrogenase
MSQPTEKGISNNKNTFSGLRAVLITGAAGGIGRATVATFLQEGWYVIGVDRAQIEGSLFADGKTSLDDHSSEDALLPPDQHPLGNNRSVFIQADISLPGDIESIFAQAKNHLGDVGLPGLNALINNAAIQIAKPIIETSVEEWDAVMTNNLRSVFLGAKLAYPLLKAAGGGAIVNVSSVHAIQTSANIASYAASKGGLLALTRAMAIEFAPDDIRVNAILPGAVDTAMLRKSMSSRGISDGNLVERLENLARKTVNGRIGKPQEIARAIYFLADDHQSSFMTGQALVVDGGATARLSTE